jgi:hypothetical protein
MKDQRSPRRLIIFITKTGVDESERAFFFDAVAAMNMAKDVELKFLQLFDPLGQRTTTHGITVVELIEDAKWWCMGDENIGSLGDLLPFFYPVVFLQLKSPTRYGRNPRRAVKEVAVEMKGRIHQQMHFFGQMGFGEGSHFILKNKIMIARNKEDVGKIQGLQPFYPPSEFLDGPVVGEVPCMDQEVSLGYLGGIIMGIRDTDNPHGCNMIQTLVFGKLKLTFCSLKIHQRSLAKSGI